MKSYLKYICLFIILVLVSILAINLYSNSRFNLDTTKTITTKKSNSSKNNTSTVIKQEDNSSNDISNEESSSNTSSLNEENTSSDNTDSKEDTNDTDTTNNIDNNSSIVTRSSVVTYEYNNSEVISDNSNQTRNVDTSNEEDFVIEVDNSSNTNQVSTKEPSTNNNQSNQTSTNQSSSITSNNNTSTNNNSIQSNSTTNSNTTIKKENTLSKAKTYNKVTVLGSINSKNLTNKVTVVGTTSGRAQSFCVVGTNFITAQINNDENRTLIQVYDKNTGKKKNSIVKNFNHANGMTYNKNTNLVYAANMNGGKISTFSSTNLSTVKDFSTSNKTFSKSISSIAYDNSTNQYYFGAGDKVYVSDSNFNLIRTIKKIRKGTPQDIGAYNGIIFVIVFKPDNTVRNAIDLYRASDGGYLGTFNINVNYELESIDYYGSNNIFSLYFNISGSTDYIYNTSIDLSQIK